LKKGVSLFNDRPLGSDTTSFYYRPKIFTSNFSAVHRNFTAGQKALATMASTQHFEKKTHCYENFIYSIISLIVYYRNIRPCLRNWSLIYYLKMDTIA